MVYDVPTWLYHLTEDPRYCETRAEADALVRAGWADSPAVFASGDVFAVAEEDVAPKTKRARAPKVAA